MHEIDVPDIEIPYEGFIHVIESCNTCEVAASIDFAAEDFGSKLEQKIQQALVTNPEVNSFYTLYDAVLELGALGALRSSGRLSSLYLGLAEGQKTTMEALREGAFEGTGLGVPQEWEAYSTIDNLVRAFAGEPSVSSGIGLQGYDAEHNLAPEGEGYQPPIDFKAAYLKRWGVSG